MDRLVGQALAAQARLEALEANRHGQLDQARRVLREQAEAIEVWAGTDPELRSLVRALLREAEDLSAPKSPLELKARFYQSAAVSRGRDEASMGSRKR